jgi:ABC-type transporter Mla maintaining outer membrane lipid asymmetry ATPase subunit MlaF
MNEVKITLEDISCHFGDRTVLSDVSFGIHACEKMVL